ncbi:hypothetical protein BHO_0075000 [Borrelia hermsii YBT]|nr:hypothetical protein BHO_0075000 [Borrelia hermsii YBT]
MLFKDIFLMYDFYLVFLLFSYWLNYSVQIRDLNSRAG